MQADILNQQKMLYDILSEINSLIIFLSNINQDEEDIQKEECFIDTIKTNNSLIETLKAKVNIVDELIRGGIK